MEIKATYTGVREKDVPKLIEKLKWLEKVFRNVTLDLSSVSCEAESID